MFPVDLTSTERRELLHSTRLYVAANAGKPGVELFEAEVKWLQGDPGGAEAILREAAKPHPDVSGQALALAALCAFLHAERRLAEAEDVERVLRRIADANSDSTLRELVD